MQHYNDVSRLFSVMHNAMSEKNHLGQAIFLAFFRLSCIECVWVLGKELTFR